MTIVIYMANIITPLVLRCNRIRSIFIPCLNKIKDPLYHFLKSRCCYSDY